MTLQTFSGRRASQNEYELHALIDLFKAEGVASYLEIGSREGDTFYDVVSSLPPGSRALAVDLPGGLWGKSTTGQQLKKAVAALVKKGYKAAYMLGDSTDIKMISSIACMAPFDAVLIDGDHRYEGAKLDWENYGPMARLVAFHDIVGDGCVEKVHNTPVEVPRLWAEIKAEHKHLEFIGQDSKMGIGCVIR